MMKRSLVVNKEFTAKDDSFFEGGNFFINNGIDGLIDEINGKGNLIVGGKSADVAANPGSHNVIIGYKNKYSSYGGLVAGYGNEISEEFASVTGGYSSVASGPHSPVTGGNGNIASGWYSSIGGGMDNRTPYLSSTITGTRDKETKSNYENLP